MSFTDVYTGSPVNPQDISYRAVTLSANATLEFPTLGQDTTNVIARIMDVAPSAGSLSLTLPAANLTGKGFDTLIRNTGAVTFTVLNNAGGTITTVAAGAVVYIYLTSNTTVAGSWSAFTFGTGTSAADANALAGLGLTAIGATLNAEHDVDTVTTNYVVTSNDRAKLKKWTGGGGTITVPIAATTGNGFFFLVRNSGTGVLSIVCSGTDTIDGAGTATLNQGESCLVFCDGSVWNTVGQGRSVVSTITNLSKSVAGGSNVNLTSVEAAYSILEFTGTLTASIDVTVPAAVGRWTVSNNTSGAYTLTFKPLAGTGLVITQGNKIDVYTDGVAMYATHDVSVAITPPAAGLAVSGSPVVNTGTMVLTLADDLAAIEGLASTGIVRRTGSNTWSAGTAVNLATEVTGILPATSFPALTGDVTTSSGSVATTIANNAVTSVKVLDKNITYAKIQDVAANSVLARADAADGVVSAVALTASRLMGRGSSGNVAAIGLGSGLSISGTTLALSRPILALCQFDGAATPPAMFGTAINVASVTRNSTGDFTINFSSALPGDNFSFNVQITAGGIASALGWVYARTSSNVSIRTATPNTLTNIPEINVVVC